VQSRSLQLEMEQCSAPNLPGKTRLDQKSGEECGQHRQTRKRSPHLAPAAVGVPSRRRRPASFYHPEYPSVYRASPRVIHLIGNGKAPPIPPASSFTNHAPPLLLTYNTIPDSAPPLPILGTQFSVDPISGPIWIFAVILQGSWLWRLLR